jgi:holo-[acyl-carrier protein] synthase
MILLTTILGIGLDIVEIPRLRQAVEKRGPRFLDKVFTPLEQAACRKKGKGRLASLAARWAVKEAVYKACGAYWKGAASHNQVEVISTPSGKPEIRLLKGAQKSLAGCRVERIEVSLSHEREAAVAVAILIGKQS